MEKTDKKNKKRQNCVFIEVFIIKKKLIDIMIKRILQHNIRSSNTWGFIPPIHSFHQFNIDSTRRIFNQQPLIINTTIHFNSLVFVILMYSIIFFNLIN